jgi:hypothetical protein
MTTDSPWIHLNPPASGVVVLHYAVEHEEAA